MYVGYMDIHVHVCTRVCRGQRSTFNVVLTLTLLSWNLEFIDSAGLAGQCLSSPKALPHSVFMWMLREDLNWSFHASLANALLTEPPPQYSLYFNVAVGISLSSVLAFLYFWDGVLLSTGQSGLHLVPSLHHSRAGIIDIHHHGRLLL